MGYSSRKFRSEQNKVSDDNSYDVTEEVHLPLYKKEGLNCSGTRITLKVLYSFYQQRKSNHSFQNFDIVNR